jgi:hypothetical protein
MTMSDGRLPVGTRVRYHGGAGAAGEYIIQGYDDPAQHRPRRLRADLIAEAYPGGIAYQLWPPGVPVKFANRNQAVYFVRRASFDVIGQPGDTPATDGRDDDRR